jgi:hypothetical protein
VGARPTSATVRDRASRSVCGSPSPRAFGEHPIARSTAPPPPAPIAVVDVVAKLEKMAAKPQKLNWKTSIVDLLKLLDIDSSYDARKGLAGELGCPDNPMSDSAQVNMCLHKTMLKKIATIRDGVQIGGTNLYALMFAIVIGSVGLNVNSTAVIIGAMLISPLMGPIFGAGYGGVGVQDSQLVRLALRNLAVLTGISLTISTLYFVLTPLEVRASPRPDSGCTGTGPRFAVPTRCCC